MSDHRAARNRLAIEANHFGLDTDTAARLAARAESMGLLSDQMPEIDALEALAEGEWEYGVQSREYSEHAKMWSGWGHFAIPFDKQRTRESCEQFIKGRLSTRFEYRLVRRRVSPTEVI